MISLREVSLEVRGRMLLDGVSFDFEDGKVYGLLGPNGAGKTTLAKVLCGATREQAGRVTFDGRPVPRRERRRRSYFVMQDADYQLYAGSVADEVVLGRRVDEALKARAWEALEAFDLVDLADRHPASLSGGQKQRIAIAGAVAMEPECIVFDEPTAMLDPRGRREVMNVIHRLNEKGITALLITHFMEEAAQADKVIVLDQGEVKMIGTPLEIFRRAEELKALSLGVPPAVDLADRLRQRGIEGPQDLLEVEDIVRYLCQLK